MENEVKEAITEEVGETEEVEKVKADTDTETEPKSEAEVKGDTEHKTDAEPNIEAEPDTNGEPHTDGNPDTNGKPDTDTESHTDDKETPIAKDKYIEEINLMKAQLEELKSQLMESRNVYDRMNREFAEFTKLYPNVPFDTLDENILLQVKNGANLSACYALYERKAKMNAEKADSVNQRNKEISSGALNKNTNDDFFSLSEVRAMSAKEVRANYSKIMESMKKWH